MNLSNQSSETMVATTTHEFFAPATIKPLFWRPRFRVNSPVQLHAPMLLWLAADARIKHVGVLGVGDGFAHFLFCQAIDKLNTQGCCSGFGFWIDRDSGAARVQPPSVLSEHAEQFYEDISDIRTCLGTTEAIETIIENSLDLLFIDLDALAENDYPHVEDLIRLLQSNAIMIIHGTNALRRDSDHGVTLAKQLGRLERLEFREGAGLTVFPIGEEQPSRLKSLMKARENGEVPRDIQLVFRRLGQSLAAIEETRTLKSKIASSTKALAEVQEKLKSTKQELADLSDAYEQRSRKVSESQSLVFDVQTKLTTVSEEKARLEKSLVATERALEATQAELRTHDHDLTAAQAATLEAVARAENAEHALEATQAELKAYEQEVGAAQSELANAQNSWKSASERATQLESEIKVTQRALDIEKATRFEETAALTRMLENTRLDVETAQDKRKTESERAAQLETALNEALEKIEVLEFQNEELLNSTSWRMTAPMRTVKTAFSK
ncbi:hypothetical protein [uncultured Roseovarius sp.]|uniref:hypothetical protein n=1 Tax=uncultured Roseovarius sp. TaxID=293344 RepID=UPI002615FCE0|nr:hypothetical protein [uncultured Roseovarius sp.]